MTNTDGAPPPGSAGNPAPVAGGLQSPANAPVFQPSPGKPQGSPPAPAPAATSAPTGGLTEVHPDSRADGWKVENVNSPNAPGFDPSKPSATKDQFGEWSVTDANDSQGKGSPADLEAQLADQKKKASAKPAASGINASVQQKMIALRAQGYSTQEIHDYLATKQDALLKQGYTQDDVDHYFGFTLDARVGVDNQLANNTGPKEADDNPLTALWDGVTQYSLAAETAHTITGTPNKLAPQQKSLLSSAAQTLGTVAPSMPVIAGTTSVGAAAGGGIGAFFGGVGAVPGAAIGGVIGFGVGWYMDTFGRNAYADGMINGGVKSPQDFAQRATQVAIKSAQETAPVVAMAAVSGPLGAGAEALGLGTAAKIGVQVAGELTASEVTQGLITQQLPTMQEVVDNAIQLGVMHGVGAGASWLTGRDKAAGKTTKGPPPPIEPGEVTQTMNDLMRHYAITGEAPGEAVVRVARDTTHDALASKNETQNYPLRPETKAEITTHWHEQGLDDYSPAIRSRWYATAVDQGVEVANTLLKNSNGDPFTFNQLRMADLKKQYADDPTRFGNDIKGYVERLDSQAPPAPEARAAGAAYLNRPKPLPKDAPGVDKTFRTNLEDDLHRLSTQAQNVDNILRAKISALPKEMTKPSADGGFETLSQKFNAHYHNPDGVPLEPAEQALWDKHAKDMAALANTLKDKADEYFTPEVKGATSSAELTGGQNMLPQLGRRSQVNDLIHTDSDDFFANRAHEIATLQATVRRGELLKQLQEHPHFLANAVKSVKPGTETEIPPKGWMSPKAMPGWTMDKTLAQAIDDFANGGPGHMIDTAVPALTALNKASVNIMFSTPLGVIAHAKNLTEMALVGRGWDNLNVMRTVRTGTAAMLDTFGNGAVTSEILENGGSLLASHIHADNLYTFALKKMGRDIADQPGIFDSVAKKFGLKGAVDFGKAIIRWQSKALYGYGDVIYKQRYLELREKGMSPREAIKEVERFIPNYRLSTKVAGSRTLANVIGAQNVIQFGRYDLSRFKAVANMFGDLLAPGSSVKLRVQAAGQFAAMATLLYIVKPHLDEMAKWITGNPDASMDLGGTSAIFESMIKLGTDWDGANPSRPVNNLYSLIGKTFNPSMTSNEVYQQLTGMDNFTGKPVGTGGLSQQVVERVWHFGGATISAAPALTNFPKWVEQGVGIKQPSAGAAFYDATQGYVKYRGHWVSQGALQKTKDYPWEQTVIDAANNLLGF